jgi:(p)ppGpp synthase/HD superfamily hydrolase
MTDQPDKVELASHFAYLAHNGQVRKGTGAPYFTHVEAVANTLQRYGFPEDVVAAGYLHDVLEDTPTPPGVIASFFGEAVLRLVLEVTDVSKPEHGNRATRKLLDRQHLAASSYEGACIKLADIIDNTSTVMRDQPKFAPVYLPEKVALLEVLRHGNPQLWAEAEVVVSAAVAELGGVASST